MPLDETTLDFLTRLEQKLDAVLRLTAAPAVEITDPWLPRDEAAEYLNVSKRSFDRFREAHPEPLKPASEHPLRWSKSALDSFKMSQAAPIRRAGRRPSVFRPPVQASA